MRTAEEILAEQVALFPSTWLDPVVAAIEQAQREAVEECAKVAESKWEKKLGQPDPPPFDIPAAIRNLLPNKEEGNG